MARVGGESTKVVRVDGGDHGAAGEVGDGHDEGVDGEFGPGPGGAQELASANPCAGVDGVNLDSFAPKSCEHSGVGGPAAHDFGEDCGHGANW